MPKMSGVEMVKEIKKTEKELNLRRTPIIITTGIKTNIK
jgi:CheY-like chemotaxis protein